MVDSNRLHFCIVIGQVNNHHIQSGTDLFNHFPVLLLPGGIGTFHIQHEYFINQGIFLLHQSSHLFGHSIKHHAWGKNRDAIFLSQFHVNFYQLGFGQHASHMGIQMGGLDSIGDCPVNLCPDFLFGFKRISMHTHLLSGGIEVAVFIQ